MFFRPAVLSAQGWCWKVARDERVLSARSGFSGAGSGVSCTVALCHIVQYVVAHSQAFSSDAECTNAPLVKLFSLA